MVAETAIFDRPTRPLVPTGAVPFGRLLRSYRIQVGLSQNQLARSGGVDPAYVNRLERAPEDSTAMPSRRVVISLYEALGEAGEQCRIRLGPEDRDRLLAAAGLVPQIIIDAGGWDLYVRRLRAEVLAGLTQTLGRLDAALGTETELP